MKNNKKEIEIAAKELAKKYNEMKYDLGSIKRYSIHDFIRIQQEFENSFEEPDKTQMLEKFRKLVGLDCDLKDAQAKFSKDFPG